MYLWATMQREVKTLAISPQVFWPQLLALGARCDYFLMQDGNQYDSAYSTYQKLAGLGALELTDDDYEACKTRMRSTADWWMGHLSYDLKNQFENLTSENTEFIKIPKLKFFRPKFVFLQVAGSIQVRYPRELELELNQVLAEIQEVSPSGFQESMVEGNLELRIDYEQYKAAFNQIQSYLQRGDIYEVNYCIPLQGCLNIEHTSSFFEMINANNPTPFASFYKLNELHVFCTSPERYFAKKDQVIWSQPIKGTAPRALDPKEDKNNKQKLFNSEKERAENVMIVDLVRNDLARVCIPGSVQVEELFGLYTYPSVHQMVSTVKGTLQPHRDLWDWIEASFPMGSMTGAPKISAMKIIDEVEIFQRGIYSGSIGYIDPSGNADFNVVIRSVVWDAKSHQTYAGIGSAITLYANALDEYEECLLKGRSMIDSVLSFQKQDKN